MKLSSTPLWGVVVMGFAVVIASKSLYRQWKTQLPNTDVECKTQCQRSGKSGAMKAVYPDINTTGTRGNRPVVCECF